MHAQVAAKQAALDTLRSRAPGGLRNFEQSHDLELTYTSNAIEGNSLTAVETTLVVEQGLTIGGKKLRDHLEAIDLFEALGCVRHLAQRTGAITEADMRNLHRLVLLRSAPDIAGRYADQGRFVLVDGGRHAFPAPAEIPALMGDLGTGSPVRSRRPKPRSPPISGWSASIRSTTAMDARPDC